MEKPILKIVQIENNTKQIIVNHPVFVDRQKQGVRYLVDEENLTVELLVKDHQLSLFRRLDDYHIHAEFDGLTKTKMVLNSRQGRLIFDVKTLNLEHQANSWHIQYELSSQGVLVGQFEFVFMIIG